jgi:hypothetical protein
MQPTFGRDAISNVKHIFNWEHHVRQQRMFFQIDENDKHENKSQCEHACSALGDKILVKARKNLKHKLEFDGPCAITQVNDDDAVRFQKGIVNHVANICRIKPFDEQSLFQC